MELAPPSKPLAFDQEYARARLLLIEHPEAGPRTLTRRFKNARVKVMLETEHLLIYQAKSPTLIVIAAITPSRTTAKRP